MSEEQPLPLSNVIRLIVELTFEEAHVIFLALEDRRSVVDGREAFVIDKLKGQFE